MGTHSMSGQRPQRRRRRPLRAAAVLVSVLALVGVITVVGYALWLQRTVAGNIDQQDLRADDNAVITISPDRTGGSQPGQDDGAEATEGLDGEIDLDGDQGTAPIVGEDGAPIDVDGVEVTASNPVRPAEAGDAMNLLVIGSDSRDLASDRGRSDVIILMHVNDARDRVDLVHFPRDMFVPIAGTGGSSKINAAYAYGGAPLLVQTLQTQIEVPVDHVAIVDFESFRSMTDAIGGVTVDVAEASPGFPQGRMHMDGATGLQFVRERYALSQGDISRGQRQQAFISGILQKALSRETLTNPARVANFVDAATTNLTVDSALDVGEMRDLAFSLRSVRGADIHYTTAPWTGIDMHPAAGSIVVVAQEQMQVLSRHLAGDTMADYEDPVSPRSGFGG